MADYDLTQTGQEVQDILDGAAMQTDLTAETERAELAEQTLQGGIDAEETRAKAAEKQNADDIDVIESKIPAGASDQNQLADKEFVNNSIATATATYRGAYNLVNDLSLTVGATHEQIATALAGAISTADNNDYCFVQIPTADATPTQIASIERYKFNGTAWAYEYTLNNSGFTAAQWAALNSGITSGLVAKLLALPTNEALTLALAGKQDVLTFDSVPVDGSNNPVKSGGVYSAIGDEETRAKAAEKANADDIDNIEALIPAAASDENQLADKEYVNSSISTATATYRGSFNEVNDLSLHTDATHEQIATALAGAISTADNNDYCFVQIPTADATPTQIASIERYKFNGTAWAYEYTLNNSGFTAAQWAALNSGITSGLVAKLSALPTNDALTLALAGKQDVLTFDNEPTSGSNNPVKSGGVYDAIDAEATTRAAAIAAIVALIPEAASALNQLADKSFVNSSISTATAVFKGTYNVVVDLELSYNATQEQIATMLASKIISADNNDYCFVQIPTADATPLQIARTDRYKFNGTAWAYEYTLNNSGFTTAQWAAINSGITSLLKDKLIDLPTATELTALLAAKQNQLAFDTTPTTGSTNPVTSGGIKSAIDAEKARAEAAEADRYTKSETYNKTEINGMVSTPHQNYVTVPTYASLPSSGQSTDTIYRVSSYDGANNQVDDTVYSEYAWDGTQYVFLRVNSQIEEVFDITVYNNNTKYTDLSAALGVDGANIPSTLRRGGMSVKFVQSSDNKYVQFRCMTQNFTTDVTQWQGVDDKPTAGSDNLVKSGGVAELNTIEFKFNDAIKSGASVAFLPASTDGCMQVIPINGFKGKIGFTTYAAYNPPYNQYPTKAALLVNTSGDTFEIVAVSEARLLSQQSGSNYHWYNYITDLQVEADTEYYLLIDAIMYVYPNDLDAEIKANWRSLGAIPDSNFVVGTTLTAESIVTTTYLLYYPFVVGTQIITIDNEVLDGSKNPVSGDAVYNAILGIGIDTKWNNKTGNFVGDSLTDSTQYIAKMTELYGIQDALPKMGAGGTGYSRYPNSGNPFYHRLDYINTNCDFISVFGGTNDWSTNCPLGNKDDKDDSSFYGCLYQFYYKLRQKFPTKPVFVFTIAQRNTTTFVDVPSGIDANGLGLSIAQYNDAIRYMAERYGCFVFDSWESGIIVDNIMTYTTDGLHFNTLGSERFARFTKMKYESVNPSMFV